MRPTAGAIGEQMTAELVLTALNMALQQRRPDGVIHHSDQGSQLGFKESSQRRLIERQIVEHRAPRQASSIRASCEACR